MMKANRTLALSAIVLSGALALPALAQTTSNQNTQTSDPAAATTSSAQPNPGDSSTYATGKPLEQQSKEGFWGHANPFARKKWVKRQIDPIRDRTNELDQLQAKNRNDIHDVDTRATTGIAKANSAAALADQHAQDAATRANAANGVATTADTRATTLNGTVQNLDQYQQVSSVTVPFVAGHTALGKAGKADLDDVATKLASEKGYIIEVQGYRPFRCTRFASDGGLGCSLPCERASGTDLPYLQEWPRQAVDYRGDGDRSGCEANHQRRPRHAAAQQPRHHGSFHGIETRPPMLLPLHPAPATHRRASSNPLGAQDIPLASQQFDGQRPRARPAKHSPNQREPRQIGPSREGPFFLLRNLERLKTSAAYELQHAPEAALPAPLPADRGGERSLRRSWRMRDRRVPQERRHRCRPQRPPWPVPE